MEKKMIAELHAEVRKTNPLIHNITNYVVMNTTANALLAAGASPVMAHAKEEVADIVAIASALVINIGTLSEHWVESMLLAAEKAQACDTPCVLDPVGSGASLYRTQTCNALVKRGRPRVIRGNASEIMSLSACEVATKGVDSTVESKNAVDAAKALAEQTGATVVVSGEVDYVVSPNKISELKNGNVLMSRVTGMGCTASALIGAFVAVENDAHAAALGAMALMGVAGDMAAEKAQAPASFQMAFIDTLYELRTEDVATRLVINTYDY